MNERRRADSWSVPVSLHEVPATGRHFELCADEAARAAIARTANLRALPRLAATFDVSRHGAGGLRVAGRVSATVGQTCVVSLDPIENEIEETVDLTFVPGATTAEDVVEVATDEVPDPLLDDTIDLGAIATEFLILGIDLYPRKPEVEFQTPPVEDASEHPFAALAALRGGQGGREE
jgi:uncharacterized metal-binding protein YceD (DUF177 family)